ncbi:MAG: hypothetical protein HOB79_03985 [Rhodospirillaceae bacterium]|nr:hypothetical protein [Rhodospirillaceae bacterium]
MTPTRVLIATTQGPVEVQRITEEDPEVNSVVCLGGKAVALPISSAYDSFVRDPTGVIQKYFGHSAYRVDVAAAVDDGFSWQLGVFAAHAFAQDGNLVSGGSEPGRTIFTTGEVDRDLNILPVDHVPEKLKKLAQALSEGQVAHTTLKLYLPAENAAQIEESWLRDIGLGPEVCRVVPVARVVDLLTDLGVEEPSGSSAPRGSRDIAEIPAPPLSSAPVRMVKWGLGIAISIAILAAGSLVLFEQAFAGWVDLVGAGKYQQLETALEKEGTGTVKARLFHRYLQWSRSDAVNIAVLEKRPPQGQSCAAVRFGNVKAVLLPAKQSSKLIFEPSSMQDLCGLEIRATAASSDVFLWGRYERWGDDRPGENEMPVRSLPAGPRSGALRWSVNIPPRARPSAVIRIVVIAAGSPIDGTKDWMADQLDKARNDGALDQMARRLARLGITLLTVRHKILR